MTSAQEVEQAHGPRQRQSLGALAPYLRLTALTRGGTWGQVALLGSHGLSHRGQMYG